jgi:hypothetical protein
MQDHTIHGLVSSKPPMTHCGKPTYAVVATDDLNKVTCIKCLSVIEKVRIGGDNEENKKRRRSTTQARY